MTMNSLFKYAIGFATLQAVLFGASACSGSSDEPGPGTDPTDAVTLTADKTSIEANGTDMVTFTVRTEGKAEGEPIRLVYSFEGEQTWLDEGVTTFTTTEPGRYLFRAWAGEIRSEEVGINATAPAIPAQNWGKRCLGFQFTGVGCPSCPVLSYAIENFVSKRPDELITVSFHLFVNKKDPMEITLGRTFDRAFNPCNGGTPGYGLDMRDPDPNNTNPISVSEIEKAVDKLMQEHPAHSGVAIETTYDASTRTAKIKAHIISNTAEKYRYQIFLTENGIDTPQDGASDSYRHHNVARAVLFNSIYGTTANYGRTLTEGVEFTATHETTLDEGWNADEINVIVASLRSENDGNTWVCDNVASCKLGADAEYKINE